MFLIYDTETTGLPKSFKAPVSDSDNWPRMVQVAWQLHDDSGGLIENHNLIVRPEGYDIPFSSTQIHGITTEKALEVGVSLQEVLEKFELSVQKAKVVVGHNINFDLNIVGAEHYRKGFKSDLFELSKIDTASEVTANYCKIPGGRGGKFKFPKLGELHTILFDQAFDEAHNASADVNATARSFFELLRLGVISQPDSFLEKQVYDFYRESHPEPIAPFDIEIEKQVENFNKSLKEKENKKSSEKDWVLTDAPYFHFHNHTSFSILSATSEVNALAKKADKENMPAVGMMDHGNLMGAFHFVNAVKNVNKSRKEEGKDSIVPIVGCELYISYDYKRHKFTKDDPDQKFTQPLIAKNIEGYRNLSKLSSYGFVDGYYAGNPRISKELIAEHKENLIATTGSLTAEVPFHILNFGEQKGEEKFIYWKELFGDDFYVELIDHGLEEEKYVNKVLLSFAKKYGVKCIAQNNTYYLEKEDAEAHDILLCVRDGEKKATPIGRGRDYRFGFPNQEFYFKSDREMKILFESYPDAIENLTEILEKITPFDLAREVLLPEFDIPEQFTDERDKQDAGKRGENNYLRHLTFEGAKGRYGEITPEIEERLNFELQTIENTGYPGYFLIVQDFIEQARRMGVLVGPGRGSAAGSAVAYCIGITNVDPIKYDLLFERFLNPDRVSLPDIDIDFDDHGRGKIIKWVVDKYGFNQVAQIITYGTMAGKSSIRDTARVLDLPLSDADRIAKKTHIKLNKLFKLSDKELKEKLNGDELKDAKELLEIAKKDDLEARTINQAKVLEGSIRNTGTHACGVIITPTDIRELVPVTTGKEDLLVTQFDNAVVEDAGLLKMDFLGLKTLTIIRDACELVKQTKGLELNPDDFPLDDELTYQQIFQKGDTVGIFQYESAGMQKHLKGLVPDKFDDLIAMNALYRPGPLQYIPNFIARKHGREEIVYDLPECEEYLGETYGITVYQEQVMLLSQKLANFSKGEADSLRKAMGKKKKAELDKMFPKFIENGVGNGLDKEKLEKIWKDWEAFASYAFNKSHSTCYAYIAFQTAYLKAHYPSEYMAATLSNNMGNIKDVTFFMEACKKMGINVLSPDVNESLRSFAVNKDGDIRFGLAAIKGVGGAAVEAIISERTENGLFEDVYDFFKRVDLRQVNKKTTENLVYAGAFDEIGDYHRAQYFASNGKENNLERLSKFGHAFQEEQNQAQASLFDDLVGGVEIKFPDMEDCPKWSALQKLNQEKEVTGVYISSHPLDQYKLEIEIFQNMTVSDLQDNKEKLIGKEFNVIGMVTKAEHKVSSKNGKEFGIFTIEDYSDSLELMLFNEDYLKFKHYLDVNRFLMLRLSVSQNPYHGRIYTNVKKIDLVQDLVDNQLKKLTLLINLDEIDLERVERILSLIDQYKGDKNIEVIFRDDTEDKTLKLPARKSKIRICKELIEQISNLDAVGYKFN